MKKLVSVTLTLLILIGLAGCSTEKKDNDNAALQSNYNAALQSASEGNYENAIELLSTYPEYKDTKEKLVEYKYQLVMQLLGMDENAEPSTDDFGLPTSSNKEDRQKAYDLLAEIGEYQDSAHLREMLEQRQVYDAACEKYAEAVTLFGDGRFTAAREIFKQLDASQFVYLQRYLDGMDAMESVAGEWEGERKGSNFTTVSCTVGAPFRITKSEYRDCDWSVTALVTLNVNKYKGGTFTITKRVGFSHITEDDCMSDFMLLTGEGYQFIFEPDKGFYPLICLQKENSGKMTLIEIPKDINGTEYYYDAQSMELERK